MWEFEFLWLREFAAARFGLAWCCLKEEEISFDTNNFETSFKRWLACSASNVEDDLSIEKSLTKCQLHSRGNTANYLHVLSMPKIRNTTPLASDTSNDLNQQHAKSHPETFWTLAKIIAASRAHQLQIQFNPETWDFGISAKGDLPWIISNDVSRRWGTIILFLVLEKLATDG